MEEGLLGKENGKNKCVEAWDKGSVLRSQGACGPGV